jgi:putative endonuclease
MDQASYGWQALVSCQASRRTCGGCRAVAAQPRRRTPDRIRTPFGRFSNLQLCGSSDGKNCHAFHRTADFEPKTNRSMAGISHAPRSSMRGIGRRIVYVLRSDADPSRRYVGITSDVDQRLEWHNAGPCGYTTSYRPWSISVCIEFATEQQALKFERYLKSGSGRAFAKRHFG